MNDCQVLLDSGACVPMPFLMLVTALETTCPGMKIDPIDQNLAKLLSAANGSPIELVGSIDLHFRFSEPSINRSQNGKWDLMGPHSVCM